MYDVRQGGVKDLQFNEGMAKKRVSDLQEYTRMLDTQLVEWKKSVDTAREKYYKLNYFTTLQLLELRRELGRLAQPTGASPTLKPSVLMLLKSVSPDVSNTVVSESLHAAHQEQEATPMDEEAQEEAVPVTASIEHRAESEKMDVTTPTPVKPVPPSPTPSPLAQPSLTVEELDERQRTVYTHCTNFLGFSADHVLRAFQACGKDATIYDIEGWCEGNEDVSSAAQGEGGNEGAPEHEEEVAYEYDDSDSEEVDRAAALALLKSGKVPPSVAL